MALDNDKTYIVFLSLQNVYDKDVITNDFMGKVSLTMAELVEAAQVFALIYTRGKIRSPQNVKVE